MKEEEVAMRKSMRLIGLVLAIVLFLGMPLSAGILQEKEKQEQTVKRALEALSKGGQDELKEGKPAFTAEEAAAFVKEMVPLVEKAAGKRFKQPPEFKLVDREAMAEILEREFIPQFKNLMPGMPEEQIEQEAEVQAEIFAKAMLGKYGFRDGVLYLMPRNVEPLLKLMKVEEKHTKAVIRIIVAHELTHVLQDQQIDLKEKLQSVKSVDESQAFNAAIEGHAVFIQDMVGRELKLDDGVIEVSRLFAAGALELEDPAMEIVSKLISTQFEQIYLGGRKFIDYHYQKGGNKAIWELLASPPVKTSMIAKPETYSPLREKKPDYAKILEGLEKDFGDRKWTVTNMEIGEIMMRSAYAALEEKEREEIISKVVHVQALIANCSDPVCMGNISLFVLKDPAFGPKMMKMIEEMARKNVEKMKESPTLIVKDFVSEDFPGIKADAARKMSLSVTVLLESKKNVFVRICRGKVMLEIWGNGLDLEDEKIVEIAKKVFKRYREAIKGENGQ